MSDDGHDPERHAREYWRQRFLEMRRSAPPCLGPAVDGVLWRRMRPGEDSEGKGPQTHVLSILEFTLKPSVDVHDGSRTPRKLWDAAFRYISSIPGCSAIEWASSLGGGTDPAGPTSILCLAHWENITAWRTFQYSLGFSPIIALLDADVSNRCARLGPLAAPGLALECGSSNNDNDARDHRSTVVDVVSVVMPAEDMSSPERRLAFEDAWKTLIASVTSNGHNSLQRSYAVWLENNAPTLADPTPEEAAAATKQAAFTAFLAWDGARYSSRPVEELCSRLRASLPSASLETDNEPAATVSRKAFQLINQSIPPPEVHLASRASLQPHAWGQTNLASILSAGFPRECSADLANLRERASQNHNRSLRDAKTSPYRFPAALGSFSSQGELFEGHMPVISRCQIRAAHLRGTDHCVDVAWIHLGACTDAQSQGPRIQSQLSDRLSALPGFIKVFWASDVAYDEKLAVLAVWKDQDAQAAALQDSRRILDEVVTSSVHLAAPLRYQPLLIPRGDNGVPWLNEWRLLYLEFISFRVPAGVVERQLFEHAWGAFIAMTRPSHIAGIPVACKVMQEAGGWQPDTAGAAEESVSSSNNNNPHQLFTAVLAWPNPGARLAWYEELSRLASWSYEVFGHHLDALRISAAGGVEAHFLKLEEKHHVTGGTSMWFT